MHPRSKHWHLIGFVLLRRRDIQDVLSVRTLRGAECWTDQRLFRAKLRLVVRPKVRKACFTIPKRQTVSRLHSDEASKEFENAVESFSPLDDGNLWPDFRDKIFKVATVSLGLTKRYTRGWFDENDEAISEQIAQNGEFIWNCYHQVIQGKTFLWSLLSIVTPKTLFRGEFVR